MSDAPEQIWAVMGLEGVISFNDYDNGEQQYLRADLVDALLAAAVREGVKIGAHPDYQVIANEPAAIVAAVVRVKEKRT